MEYPQAIRLLCQLGMVKRLESGWQIPSEHQAAFDECSQVRKSNKADLDKLMAAYKVCQGIDKANESLWRGWDRHNYARSIRGIKSLLEACGGDVSKATAYLVAKAQQWEDAGLTWKIGAVAETAWNEAGKLELMGDTNANNKRIGFSGSVGEGVGGGLIAQPMDDSDLF